MVILGFLVSNQQTLLKRKVKLCFKPTLPSSWPCNELKIEAAAQMRNLKKEAYFLIKFVVYSL